MSEENKKPLRVTFPNNIIREDNGSRQATLLILTGGKSGYVLLRTPENISSKTYKSFFPSFTLQTLQLLRLTPAFVDLMMHKCINSLNYFLRCTLQKLFL